jgi:hypothetical protein
MEMPVSQQLWSNGHLKFKNGLDVIHRKFMLACADPLDLNV